MRCQIYGVVGRALEHEDGLHSARWIAIDGLTAGNQSGEPMLPSPSTTTSASSQNQGDDIALQLASTIPIWASARGAHWRASQCAVEQRRVQSSFHRRPLESRAAGICRETRADMLRAAI